MNVLSAVSVQDCRVKQRSGKFQYFFMLFRLSFFFSTMVINKTKQNKPRKVKKKIWNLEARKCDFQSSGHQKACCFVVFYLNLSGPTSGGRAPVTGFYWNPCRLGKIMTEAMSMKKVMTKVMSMTKVWLNQYNVNG